MIRTAEAVSPKHPDKMCDQISDMLLDQLLIQDPNSRVAIETMGGHGQIILMGEVTTKADIDYCGIVQNKFPQMKVSSNIVRQSSFIANGVDTGGAGDQGIMIGYACNENVDFIPQELYLARSLNKWIYMHKKVDGKTQITLCNNKIINIIASFQGVKNNELHLLIDTWKNVYDIDVNDIHINPAGEWEQGGFDADTGLTGRKIVVDAYGPRVPVGGGAFSGKDPSKVDRSGAYMARKIAIDYLLKRQAKEVYCYLAYSIGIAEPTMAVVNIDGKNEQVVGYDLRPKAIIEYLNLKNAIYEETAKWGAFGNGFMWDKYF